MERLDKVLSNLGYGSRKEIKALVKKGEVTVNGETPKKSDFKVDPENDTIMVGEEEINYRKHIYLIMNKPDGVISATFDNYEETVIDILDPEYHPFAPFPIGRLDKDTVGLLLITNDGVLNHKLIAPKNHVDKVYYAEINKSVNEKDIEAFKKGIVLDDGYKCMSAKLNIINSTEDGAEVEVTIQEGKYHQVKRMFESRDKKVVFLKRIKFGPLELNEDELSEGQYREMSKEELDVLLNI